MSLKFVDNEQKPHFVVLLRDITERKQTETKLQIAATVFESKEAMLITGADSIIIDVNQAFTRLTGYTWPEIIGKHPGMLRSDRHNEAFYDELRKSLQEHDLWQGEIWNKRKNGEIYLEWLSISVVKNKSGEITHHVATMMDITERKLAEEEMRTAKLQAIQANQAKSEFLSSMSHELRTPMNAILGFGQLLELNDEKNLTRDQREYVREILKAGYHLLNLINEVLDLSKIESGNLEVSIEIIKLSGLINECLSLITPSAEQRQISIFNNISSTQEYYLQADNLRLKQVLLNLLSNAVKYNRKQGNITLTVKPLENSKRLRILVTDTGQGLSEDQQGKLFQPFVRLGYESSDIEGTGIGLVICKRLVELMGGEVGAISKPGLGSTFWVELGLNQQTHPELDEASEVEAPCSVTLAKRNALILYIEDNPASIKVVEKLISKCADTRLISAPAPSLGLDFALAHRPDLVLLDINLPEMDGYELLQRIRTYEQLKNIPVVAISANTTKNDIKKGLNAGFIDYLSKPIDVATFYKTINRVLLR